jgi:hypothetical protein
MPNGAPPEKDQSGGIRSSLIQPTVTPLKIEMRPKMVLPQTFRLTAGLLLGHLCFKVPIAQPLSIESRQILP